LVSHFAGEEVVVQVHLKSGVVERSDEEPDVPAGCKNSAGAADQRRLALAAVLPDTPQLPAQSRNPPTGIRDVYRGYINSQHDDYARLRANEVPAGTRCAQRPLSSPAPTAPLPGDERTRRGYQHPAVRYTPHRRGVAVRPESVNTDSECPSGSVSRPRQQRRLRTVAAEPGLRRCHVCSVFARMSRYSPVLAGTKRHRVLRDAAQSGTSWHIPALDLD
jgi:hypothetical protein